MESKKYIPSQYNVLIPLKRNMTLAYNSLKGTLALWDNQDTIKYNNLLESEFVSGEDEIQKQLLFGGYIVEEGYDELFELEKEYRMHRFDRSSMILTIAPTMACNFCCDYCFQGENKPNLEMSQEVQAGIIKLIENSVSGISRLHIAWYGGEPLIKLSIIETLSKKIIQICDSNKIKYDSMIVTNGYLLDLNAAKLLSSLRVNLIQVTLDGAKDYHDTRRTLLSGAPTFNRIVNNLKEFIDLVPITVNIRVNIDSRNRNGIHELIESLNTIGLGNKKNLKLYFAPIEAITSGCHNIAAASMTKSEYGLLESKLFYQAYSYGLVNLPYPTRFRGSCAATRPRGFVVLPDGDVHKCWDTVSTPDRRIGTIFEPEDLEHSNTKNWLCWSPFDNAECRSCKILPACAGACAYKFIYSKDTLGEAAESPCISLKFNINEQLILRAVKQGIISCDDFDSDMIQTKPLELSNCFTNILCN